MVEKKLELIKDFLKNFYQSLYRILKDQKYSSAVIS